MHDLTPLDRDLLTRLGLLGRSNQSEGLVQGSLCSNTHWVVEGAREEGGTTLDRTGVGWLVGGLWSRVVVRTTYITCIFICKLTFYLYYLYMQDWT